MNSKRVLLVLIAFFVFSTVTVAANSLIGDYEGYSKIKLAINGIEKEFKSFEVPGFIIKGSTVLPLRTTAEALQALVVWDNNSRTVTLFKPSVHMIVASEIGKDYSLKTPFGVVKKGKTIDFVVFSQVDSLKTPISTLRLSIQAPSGKTIFPVNKEGEKIEEIPMVGNSESFWLPFKFDKVLFDETGEYKISLEMKLANETVFRVVSQKAIVCEE
jgi:hypothetical protein